MKVAETLERALSIQREIWDAIVGELTVTDTRQRILLEYLGVALEHHEAIIVLVRNDLRGSALSLVRSVFEILYRSAWVCTCAKPEHIEKIVKDKFDFPQMAKMVSEIDAAIGGAFFKEFKKLSWKQQNQFVHTGHLQRIGRISREDLQSPYPDEGIILQVNITTQALLLVAIFVLKAIGRVPKAERLERFMLTFGSAAQS